MRGLDPPNSGFADRRLYQFAYIAKHRAAGPTG